MYICAHYIYNVTTVLSCVWVYVAAVFNCFFGNWNVYDVIFNAYYWLTDSSMLFSVVLVTNLRFREVFIKRFWHDIYYDDLRWLTGLTVHTLLLSFSWFWDVLLWKV